MNEEFEVFLKNKKIDTVAFKQNEPQLWQEFAVLFGQVHLNSFVAQKLYLINPIRRKYPLSASAPQASEEPVKKAPKPIIKPKTA